VIAILIHELKHIFRVWLYTHEDEAGRQEKMRVYYTPDEIDAFVAAHPAP
jgi:hypothetical protein